MRDLLPWPGHCPRGINRGINQSAERDHYDQQSPRIVSLARTLSEETNVHEPEMSSSRRQLQLVASFGFLLLMAIGVGCHGFFVDPTLVSMSVQTLESTTLSNVGSTLQLQASGAYDDGSHKNLTGGYNGDGTSRSTVFQRIGRFWNHYDYARAVDLPNHQFHAIKPD
jgi:hypothetical protein